MSVRRKLANPPTPRLTPPAHPTSLYSEETAVNIQKEASRTEGFPDLTQNNNEGLCALQQPPRHPLPGLRQRTNDMPQDDWQQDTPSDEGMCSP